MASNKKNRNKLDWQSLFRIVVTFCITICGLTLFGFVAVFFYQWFSSTGEFNLKKVEVADNFLLSQQEIVTLSGLKKGQRILDIDLESLRQKLNKSSYISDCKVELVLPASVLITVIEEKPIAFLIKNGKMKYISEAYQVIGDTKPEFSYNLPLINGKFSPKLIAFLGQAKELSPFVYHQISEIVEDKRGVILSLTKNSVSVIIGREDFSEKILVIENFLREEGSKIDFANLEYIDLRFDKQVVVKEIKSEVAEAPIANTVPVLAAVPPQGQ